MEHEIECSFIRWRAASGGCCLPSPWLGKVLEWQCPGCGQTCWLRLALATPKVKRAAVSAKGGDSLDSKNNAWLECHWIHGSESCWACFFFCEATEK